jgi:hypothetical protein
VPESDVERDQPVSEANEDTKVDGILVSLEAILDSPVPLLRTDLEPWSTVLEDGRRAWGDRWTLHKLAVLAAEFLTVEPKSKCDLHDVTQPLLVRALSAKHRRQDMQWWKEQLESAAGLEGPVRPFLLMCLHRWAALSVIVALNHQLDQILDELTAPEWANLRSVMPDRKRHNPRRNAPKRSLGIASRLPDKMSLRMMCFVVERLRPDERYAVLQKYWNGCPSGDSYIDESVISIVITHAYSNPTSWEAATAQIALYYERGRVHFPHTRSEFPIPSDVARQICTEPARFPLFLVGRAETVLTQEAGAAAIPVIKIAAKDDWFGV